MADKELFKLSIKDLLLELKTSNKGLTSFEAKKRLNIYGLNEEVGKPKRQAWKIFLSQFGNPLVFVLIAATIIAYFIGESTEAIVILSIVLLNSIMGFVQEFKAERVIRELMKHIPLKVKVYRDSVISEIDSHELVPGDVIILNIGDIIPADARLINSEALSINESLLTGESLPIAKNAECFDKSCMLFSGSIIDSGEGVAVVTATGFNTEFGQLRTYLMKKPPETDFQKNIRKFGDFLLKIILSITLFVFVANALKGQPVIDSFLFALALAVGITPEMLPIIITISLSNGALRMAKKKVVVKKLSAIEDLGNINILCCDKTGTLTEGTLSLNDFVNPDGERNDELLIYGILCSSEGNQIDQALIDRGKAVSVSNELRKYSVVYRNEFDFVRRRMSVVVKGKESLFIAKGAPESILEVCSNVLISGKKEHFSQRIASKIRNKINDYESKGYKVILLATKSFSAKKSSKDDEYDLMLSGLLLFTDPPKKTAAESISILEKLGVNIKLITGDSPLIARRVCESVNLSINENKIVTGEELNGLGSDEFSDYCRRYNIFTRINPEQKYMIVSKLNQLGNIVGFIGDGVNDAPALKVADVGISVNTATGVAREAADILLLQKSLRVLSDGINEGRKTFGNVIKYIYNTISANFGNMITVAASSLFLPFIPLLPSQILLNNFMSDTPLLTISTDNVDKNYTLKPKRWSIRSIGRFMAVFGVLSSVFDIAFILPLLFVIGAGPELFRTAWFVESCLSEIIVTFAIRTRLPFYKSRPSKWLLISSIATIIVSVLITYTFFGFDLFEFVAMPANVIALLALVLVSYFLSAELLKRWFFRTEEH